MAAQLLSVISAQAHHHTGTELGVVRYCQKLCIGIGAFFGKMIG
jgi:hypothetical protein